MAWNLATLRGKTDAELIAAHDELAVHTQVGTQYFVDELNRRDMERSSAASLELARSADRLARRAFWLSLVAAVTAIAGVVIQLLGK